MSFAVQYCKRSFGAVQNDQHGNMLKMEAVRFSGTSVKVSYPEGVNFYA